MCPDCATIVPWTGDFYPFCAVAALPPVASSPASFLSPSSSERQSRIACRCSPSKWGSFRSRSCPPVTNRCHPRPINRNRKGPFVAGGRFRLDGHSHTLTLAQLAWPGSCSLGHEIRVTSGKRGGSFGGRPFHHGFTVSAPSVPAAFGAVGPAPPLLPNEKTTTSERWGWPSL